MSWYIHSWFGAFRLPGNVSDANPTVLVMSPHRESRIVPNGGVSMRGVMASVGVLVVTSEEQLLDHVL